MTLAPAHVRYIKLGRGGQWETISLERGELHFGYSKVPHELALSCDRDQIRRYLIRQGRDPRSASEDAREVVDFYGLGENCLWITFAREHLWWAFARSGVVWLGASDDHGARYREAIRGWQRTDIDGAALRMATLSTKLTQLASYRRTICAVGCEDYLLRRINGIVEPLQAESIRALETLVDVTAESIRTLQWRDFETLVDIIFARSGWFRASAIGGNQKLFDMVLEQPTLRETCAVQVKATAGQRQLDEFVELADATEVFDRLFFVCHTARGRLEPPTDRPGVHIWTGEELAATSVRLGLAEWIVEKIS